MGRRISYVLQAAPASSAASERYLRFTAGDNLSPIEISVKAWTLNPPDQSIATVDNPSDAHITKPGLYKFPLRVASTKP